MLVLPLRRRWLATCSGCCCVPVWHALRIFPTSGRVSYDEGATLKGNIHLSALSLHTQRNRRESNSHSHYWLASFPSWWTTVIPRFQTARSFHKAIWRRTGGTIPPRTVEELGGVEPPKPISRTCSLSRRVDLPMSNSSSRCRLTLSWLVAMLASKAEGTAQRSLVPFAGHRSAALR